MRLLVVALGESVHTARWLSQITDQKWNVCLFPSVDCGYIHEDISGLTVFYTFYCPSQNKNLNVRFIGIPVPSQRLALWLRLILQNLFPRYLEAYLSIVIKLFHPDLLHSMELIKAGFFVSRVKEKFKGKFPRWLVTNWGSEMYLFGRLNENKAKIKKLLTSCDLFSCESGRDAHLARDFGFKGKIVGTFPVTGGFDLQHWKKLKTEKPSDRKVILLKGYQGPAGRALVGLRALARCKDLLKGYKLVIYSSRDVVNMAAEIFQQETGVPVIIVPRDTSHEKMMEWQSKARISLGVSMGDGISTVLLEAMVMGAFPIQTWTSSANEWIQDGVGGILIPPEDPDIIAKAIKKVLKNNLLIDRAAKINYATALKRLDYEYLKKKTINLYLAAIK